MLMQNTPQECIASIPTVCPFSMHARSIGDRQESTQFRTFNRFLHFIKSGLAANEAIAVIQAELVQK
jgi:hypothetical protein